MEPEFLVTIDGKQYARFYNDGEGWPHPECEREAERAFRDAYLAAAREVSEWDFPVIEEVEAAWEARQEARRQAEVLVTSAQLFNDPAYDDYDPPGTHFVYQIGHEVEASRARGRHHAMELCRRDWWELIDLNFEDDEDIRGLFMRPWVEAVAAWANTPLDSGLTPPRPIEQFSAVQWRAVLSKQKGIERIFDSIEAAENDLAERFNCWSERWKCWDTNNVFIGYVYDWRARCCNDARLLAKCGDRWLYYDREKTPRDATASSVVLPHPIARRLITVPHEQLEWLWPGRIALTVK